MVEHTEFSTNDRYLIREYRKHGSNDYYLTDIGNKTFVVPCHYIAKTRNGIEGIRLFKEDLLDFQKDELKQYLNKNKEPRKIKIADDEFIVPYQTPADFDTKEIVSSIIAKAEVKYNAIINAHRMLKETNTTNFSTTTLNKYTKKLAKQHISLLLAPEAIKHLEIYQSLRLLAKEHGRKVTPHINKAIQKLRTKILKCEFKSLKKYKPKYWKLALLGGMLSVSGYHLYHSFKEYEETKIQPYAENIIKTTTFTDFKGKTYSDSLQNLNNIRILQPQIIAMLLSIEGFSENAFLDGKGNPTIGSGFTKIISEDGKEIKVKLGDKTTIKKDIIQNTRYIEREFSALMGDNIGRTLSPEEILACIGSGYCWGTNGFAESSFFKSLKMNEPLKTQCQKLSGFRTPIGLIKREFLLAQILSGNWSIENILHLPVYYVKNKGYIHCGIYTLDIHDCVPCKKDKNGKYLKDNKGYDIPLITQDGFCKPFYTPTIDEILSKIYEHPENKGKPYKTVGQLLYSHLKEQVKLKAPKFYNIPTLVISHQRSKEC